MIKGKFLARGTAMVCDHAALDAGIRRFVGRKLVDLGEDQYGFAPLPPESPSEVAISGEIKLACQAGDLWPADEETARACGVPFDPKFGGEFASAKKPAADAAKEKI